MEQDTVLSATTSELHVFLLHLRTHSLRPGMSGVLRLSSSMSVVQRRGSPSIPLTWHRPGGADMAGWRGSTSNRQV